MIPKEKIEQAAKKYGDKAADQAVDITLSDLKEYAATDFTAGVRFAEAEMKQIAVEYGVWIETKSRYLYKIKEGEWRTFNKKENPLTPKEHFELFLQERNNS